MGILKDAILAAIQQEHPDAHWVGNEKPHMIESTAQAKYNDVRRVERNYTKGVHKAIVTVQDIYRCDSCKAASDELGRGCKHGMLFPLMLIMGNFTECMNYEFDAEKVKLQLKRKEAK